MRRIETQSYFENEVAEDELSFIIEFEDEQEPAIENGQNLQEQVVAPTTSNVQTNEQLNIVHGVFESEPSVLNLVENCPAQRPRGRPCKNPISDQRRQFWSTPFNNANIINGTKLLDILFTKEELTQGTVEPSKNTTPSLERRRVDLIKICFFKRFRSLKQKCLDSRRSAKKSNDSPQSNLQDEGIDVRRRRRIVYEAEESDEASITREEDSIEEDEARRPIVRDQTMNSIN
ncbi:hypothetical protein BpHYR1_025338 [Brachionus plicatilis]|uniref:Uncharacterized protein n=1 Tax=Brachionus plicatilis TaxID=10195 RepID=A0A3M7RKD8_BRAPC|nr:hypothetical protein BpHYR1_025338 [Brachionus plicatilis]